MLDFQFDFRYEGEEIPALKNAAGQIRRGSCIVLCGSSGCGKSSLLRCFNHLVPQFYEGELEGFCYIDGRDTAGLSIGQVGELAASVFQDPRSQFFTVNSNTEVAFGMENHGIPKDVIVRRVDEAFARFSLERLRDRNVYEMSSGERQFISILSAWAMDTDILLLDEPTANLDYAAAMQLQKMLLELKEQGKTLILSEHRLHYLSGIADEFWLMEDGQIKRRWSAEQMMKLTAEETKALALRTLDLGSITLQRESLPESSGSAPFTFGASNLRFDYRGEQKALLRGVSFEARCGEVIGIVGSNGCGKTTLGKLLTGLLRPSGGSVLYNGKRLRPKELQKRGLFVMQEAEFQFFTNSVLNELKYGHIVTPEFEAEAERLLKKFGMWECCGRHPFSLSGGQMQKLSLMIAYFSPKQIVVLDEPTAGLDAKSLQSCGELIREMRRKKLVFVITHDLELIAQACTSCICVSDGKTDREIRLTDSARLKELMLYIEGTAESGPWTEKDNPAEKDGPAGKGAFLEKGDSVETDGPAEKAGPAEKDSFAQSTARRPCRLHPIVKLLFWLTTLTAVSTANNAFLFSVYAALILMVFADGWYVMAVAGGALAALLLGLKGLFSHTVAAFALTLLPRALAIWLSVDVMIGRNEASRTIAALRAVHVPERLIMIVSVIFRFFPVLSEDMKLMRQSIRTRGAFTTLSQKLRSLPEYIEILTVPMALRVIRIAETLSASAETRGIALKGKRSSYVSLHYGAWDLIFFLLLIAAAAAGLTI